ncbi:MAG: lipopolysaccharide transport periplasmic protein LptA [Desulfuromonadales bacterium]|nr:lipopolysaccharide transport periplasmic protein LptA [Desulfuromonadales bacterium]
MFGVFGGSATGFAQDKPAARQEPITVSAASMEADQASGTLIFTGQAVAEQGELTLHADRLIVYYAEQSREIERVVAEGSVRIIHPLREATGNHAVFLHSEQHITLTGDPVVRQGASFVRGERIDLYLAEQRSVVTGGAGRVSARFEEQDSEVR